MKGKTLPEGVERHGRFIRVDGEMTWPLPVGPAEWNLRYGQPTREDILHAASCMNALYALAAKPRDDQRRIAKAIVAGVTDYQRSGNDD